jgi:hypothetical protein
MGNCCLQCSSSIFIFRQPLTKARLLDELIKKGTLTGFVQHDNLSFIDRCQDNQRR